MPSSPSDMDASSASQPGHDVEPSKQLDVQEDARHRTVSRTSRRTNGPYGSARR